MRLIEKIGAIIGLAVIMAMAVLGTGYAMPVTNTAAAVTPNQAPLSLCTFSWVQSNDDGTVSSHDGYNPVDPGGNTGNDPKAAQTPGAACTRTAYNAAATTATGTASTITFNLSNAYPGYNPTIFFGLSNQWATPGIVSSITYTNPNPALLTITLKGVSTGQVINASTEVVGALDIAVGNIPQSGSPSYSLSVTIVVNQSGPAFSINPISLPDGQIGITYNQTLTVANGNPPYTWSVSSGALPGGLSLNTATGAITGAPNTSGTFNFTVQVADITGSIAGLALSINVPPLPTTTTPVITTITVTPTTPVVTLSQQITTTAIPGETHTLAIDMFGNTGELTVNSDGSLAAPYTVSLPDGSVSLSFSAGTIITADGEIPDRIDIELASASEQQDMPDNWQPVSKLYKLVAYVGNKVATHTVFSQPFLLTIHCNTANIPDGDEAFMAYYETATGWVGISSTYDAKTGDVSAYVNHFTLFAGMLKTGTKQSAISRWWSSNRWWIIIITAVVLAGLWLLWSFILFRMRRKKLLVFIIKRLTEGATRQQLLEVEIASFIRENHLPPYSNPDIERMVDWAIKKYTGK
jgi:Putative Ig domain